MTVWCLGHFVPTETREKKLSSRKKVQDPKISVLARECTFKIQGFSKPSKRTTIVERSSNDVMNEMTRLQRVYTDTNTDDTQETDASKLSAMGRFLPAPGKQVLCFYCRRIVTVHADRLEQTVRKSRTSPSNFTACCDQCYQDVFVL